MNWQLHSGQSRRSLVGCGRDLSCGTTAHLARSHGGTSRRPCVSRVLAVREHWSDHGQSTSGFGSLLSKNPALTPTRQKRLVKFQCGTHLRGAHLAVASLSISRNRPVAASATVHVRGRIRRLLTHGLLAEAIAAQLGPHCLYGDVWTVGGSYCSGARFLSTCVLMYAIT